MKKNKAKVLAEIKRTSALSSFNLEVLLSPIVLCRTKCTHYSNLSCLIAFIYELHFKLVYTRNVTFFPSVMEATGTVIDGGNAMCLSLGLKSLQQILVASCIKNADR